MHAREDGESDLRFAQRHAVVFALAQRSHQIPSQEYGHRQVRVLVGPTSKRGSYEGRDGVGGALDRTRGAEPLPDFGETRAELIAGGLVL